jgi:DNA polymerase-1
MIPFDCVPYVAIDVETKGLRWWLPEEGIFGIAVAYPDGSSYYFDTRRQPEGIEWLKAQKPNKIVNHNIKFDLHMLHSIGVMYPPEICECTMVRASLIDENLQAYSLQDLAEKYLKSSKEVEIYDALWNVYGGKKTRKEQIKNLHLADPALVANYAKKDAILALNLWKWQEKEIKKQDLKKIVALEQNLFPVIFDMERNGVCVDIKKAEDAVEKIDTIIRENKKNLFNIVGFECNYNPSKDMLRLFKPVKNDKGEWVACDGTILENTPKGQPKLDSEALRLMEHPAAEVILNIRKWVKCKEVFLKGYILDCAHEGKLHPNIHQTKGEHKGTKTGRLSYSQPALQQIPARDSEIANILRPIFIPDPDYLWAKWDYSQFEFRMFSHYVNDIGIINAFIKNPRLDFHSMVADLTGLPRNATISGGGNAKQLNLAIMYDMGERSIARLLKLPLSERIESFINKEGQTVYYMKAGEEAQNIISSYHRSIPGVKELRDKIKIEAKVKGYNISIAGRHLRYPKGLGIHKSKARLCQSSSADCMKQKLIEVYNYFKHEEPLCRIYITVHDEIGIGIPCNAPNLLAIIRNVTKILENFDGIKCPIRVNIPIKTDFGIGYSWAEASGK